MAPRTAYSLRGDSVGGGPLELAFKRRSGLGFHSTFGCVRFALAFDVSEAIDRSVDQERLVVADLLVADRAGVLRHCALDCADAMRFGRGARGGALAEGGSRRPEDVRRHGSVTFPIDGTQYIIFAFKCKPKIKLLLLSSTVRIVRHVPRTPEG